MALRDFAQFIEIETKEDKTFFGCLFNNELIVHKTIKQQKVCARNVSDLFMSQ